MDGNGRGTEQAVDALRYGEEHYRALFNAVADAVVVHEVRDDGPPGRFLEVNAVACKRLGYTREELLQLTPVDIDAPDSDVDINSVGHRILLGETVTFEQVHVAKDGRRIPVEIRAQRFNLAGRPCVLSLVRDITERKQAEQKLRRQKDLYATVSEINQSLIRLPKDDEIYQQVCRTAVQRGGFLFAWIGETDAAASTIRLAARYGHDEGYIGAALPSLSAVLPNGPGAIATAIREGRHVVVNDFMAEPSVAPWQGIARRAGVRAFGAFPIRRGGRVMAVLSVYADTPGFFDGETDQMLTEIALDVSFALDNAERERREAAATAALADAEERFRQIAQSIREVFWLTDPAKQQILYVSPAYEQIWGRSCKSLMESPQTWIEAIHPDDRQRVLHAVQTRQVTTEHVEEYRVRRPDGTIRWIRDEALPVRGKEGRVVRVAGVAEDITERKLAIDELRESERRFRGMLDTVEMVAITLDRQARITYCNDYLLRSTGWRREEILGQDWFEVFTPPENSHLKAVFASLLQNNHEAWHHENEILTRSGERRLIEWNNTALRAAGGEVIGTASIGVDVTQRHRTQEALAEQEEKFRALAEQSIAGIYMIDGEMISYMNPRAAEIFGYLPEEVVGRPARNFVCEEDWPKLEENVRRRLLGDITSVQYEFKGRRKNGTTAMIGVHGTTAVVGGRRIIIGVLQDVTEKLRAEETICGYVARLERAILGTVDAVSRMVELRDPYTAGHERRVGELASAIAAEMGLPEQDIKGLRITGLVHDIGKISIPAEILSKPSQLTAPEYEMIKAHPRLGYDILKSVDFPWPIADVVLQHHERFDGSGYPQGLKGEEISLLARILAVADTVEAMASHRPYRPGQGIAAALKEIEDKSGTLYDAAVVDVCLRLFREKNYHLPT